jgi:hypothetical protein
MEHIPPNWDDSNSGEIAFGTYTSEQVGHWLRMVREEVVTAVTNENLAKRSTIELGFQVSVSSVVPEFHHGDIWVQITASRGWYKVAKRTT